jgi:flagella basal body P-ring formation protein FlgA
MIRKLIIASAVLLAYSAGAAAEQLAALDHGRPRLKPVTVVTGDLVRIGDLVENAGVVAKVPIFRSPDLGSTGSVPAETVIEAVRAHALIGLDPDGVRDVVVTRATRTIDADELQQSIAAAIAAQYSIGREEDMSVSFDRMPRPIHVEPSVGHELRVERLHYNARSTRFYANVNLPGRRSVWLTGHAQAMVEVVTLAHSVGRGELVKQADLIVERRPRRKTGRDVITDRTEAVGLAARNSLQAGRLLRSADLMKPELVRRNESVTLIYQIPGVSLTARGKATESGAEGEQISVRNEQSRRTVQGVVVGPGRVVVSAHPPLLAASSVPAR